MMLRDAILTLPAVLCCMTSAMAQGFSPWIEPSGRGPYDQYRDTVMCNVVLDRALADSRLAADRARLEQGKAYTAGFALFLLESAGVADGTGAILGADSLSADLDALGAVWDAVLRSAGPDSALPAEEIARCLAIYGHDW